MPTSLDEALEQLAVNERCRPVAGGTDLFVRWPDRPRRADSPLLDLSGISILRRLDLQADVLVIGAMSTYWDFLSNRDLCQSFPLLAQAARQIGAIQVQARGTWAGNVANASPAADGVLALMAQGALVELRSVNGVRECPLESFYRGYRQTHMKPNELITALRVPLRPGADHVFEKVGGRRAQTISRVGLAICCQESGWRVAVNGMAPVVKRCLNIEDALQRNRPPRDLEAWLELARRDLEPIDDHRASRNYREQVLARLLLAWSS